MNAIFDYLPVWHDHTPAYTSSLYAKQGSILTLRFKTLLEPKKVSLSAVLGGEIITRAVREIAPLDGEGRWFEFALELTERVNRYCWLLELEDDTLYFSKAGLSHPRRPYRDWFSFVADYQAPEWTWGSVFYQIFPDRFRHGNPANKAQAGEFHYPNFHPELLEWMSVEGSPLKGRLEGKPVRTPDWDTPLELKQDMHTRYGGDLEGVRQSLPYLQELGVNALWLNPIFDSPSSHRYDIRDYRTVDKHLGGQISFDALMVDLKATGFRVILDGVFNHLSNEHALFTKAFLDPSSLERKFFSFKNEPVRGQTPYHGFFDVATMPKIDYASEVSFLEFIDGENSVVRHWLRQGIDGWRLDVAQGMGGGGGDADNLEIHRRLKGAARQENPEAYIVGERFFDAEHALQDGQGEDGVMNYHGFSLPVMSWFCGTDLEERPTQIDGEELLELLWDAYHALPAPIALNQFNLLESHDIARALYRLKSDKRLFLSALTLLMAYPGVPCLYYGSEIGLSQTEGKNMSSARATMPWNEEKWDLDLQGEIKTLIKIRRSSVVLQRGTMRLLGAGEDTVGFLREYTDETGKVSRMACLVARSSVETAELEVTLPTGNWTDVLTGTDFGLGGSMRLEFTGAILLEDRSGL